MELLSTDDIIVYTPNANYNGTVFWNNILFAWQQQYACWGIVMQL
jgi:hypothetical protein